MIAAPNSKTFCPKCLEFDCEHVNAPEKIPLRVDADALGKVLEDLASDASISRDKAKRIADLQEAIKERKKKPQKPIGTNGPKGVGRGPTGRLRNFRQMTDDKLAKVYKQIVAENTDHEAMDVCGAEVRARGL